MPQRDRNLEEVAHNIDAFERALEAGMTTLPEPSCRRVLAVSDGSNQEEALVGILRDLLGRLAPLDGVHLLADDDRPLRAGLGGTAIAETPRPRQTLAAEDAHRAILETAREVHADLVLLPTPFAGDYEDLGSDSLGATVDVLLERMQLPLVAVRHPDRRSVLDHVALFVEDADAPSLRAAAWALHLAKGPLEVIVAASAAEREGWEHLAGRLHEIDDDAIREALDRGTAPLVAAVHRAALETEREARVRIAAESLEVVVAARSEQPALLVVPHGPLARDVVRHARDPVLVVP